MTHRATDNPTRRLSTVIEDMFRRTGIVTLETRGRDHLDFPSISVAELDQLIMEAYTAGVDDENARTEDAYQSKMELRYNTQ